MRNRRSASGVRVVGVLLAAACGADPTPGAEGSVVVSPAQAPEATSAVATEADRVVKGTINTRDGVEVVHVWGTPEEMGYAHGRLLAPRIIEIVDGYALDAVPPAAFELGRVAFGSAAKVSDRRRAEAGGVIAGMRDAGSIRVPRLERDLTADDLLFINAITDILTVGCSSVTAWGEGTRDDPELAGELATIRNLDWHTDPDLLRNQVVFAFEPTEGQRMISVGFAGYLGCLSCMNEAGVTALFNMGYGEGAATRAQALEGFSPANLTLRDILERGDVDGDGDVSADDVESGLRSHTHAGSWILAVLESVEASTARDDPPARVLEVEHSGVVARLPDEDAMGSTLLAATNHMRSKHAPTPCRRYRTIEGRARTEDRHFTREELWELGEEVALNEVVHTLFVRPAARSIEVRLRRPDTARGDWPSPVTVGFDTVFPASTP